MSNLFNTTFENSLRVLLVLAADAKKPKTADMIAAVDFLTIYGGTLGLTDTNLHGENPFSFSEFTSRRELVFDAVKELVVKGLVTAEKCQTGFCYKISPIGMNVVSSLDSDFATEYAVAVHQTLEWAGEKDEQEIIAFMDEGATLALKEGGDNG